MLELTPVLSDYVYQVGGADARDLFDRTMVGAAETGNAATIGGKTWFEMDLEEKKEAWFSRRPGGPCRPAAPSTGPQPPCPGS